MKLKLPVPKNETQQSLSSETFKVYCFESEDRNELLIFDAIGDMGDGTGVGAAEVVDFLKKSNNKNIRVRINSPGGLAYDGIVIHNALKDYPGNVEIVIEGLAASAGAIIAMAGDKRKMQENGTLFVHRAWGGMVGNSAAFLDQAEALDVLDKSIAKTLAAKSDKLTVQSAYDLMVGEVDGTRLNAEKALELGLIDEIVSVKRDSSEVENADLKRINNYLKLEAKAKCDVKFGSIPSKPEKPKTEVYREGFDQPIAEGAD